ncbi:hypothetical protein ACBR40_26705 [Nonomuraea sp. AD125B]|uniref:hypothetical protein n=1 Tax=Nonomuraea sp. AD125B TaxID=3242897 RepID=UPI00352751FF
MDGSQLLGSTYFVIRETGNLRRIGEPEERITAVATWRDATYLTEPEGGPHAELAGPAFQEWLDAQL